MNSITLRSSSGVNLTSTGAVLFCQSGATCNNIFTLRFNSSAVSLSGYSLAVLEKFLLSVAISYVLLYLLATLYNQDFKTRRGGWNKNKSGGGGDYHGRSMRSYILFSSTVQAISDTHPASQTLHIKFY